jgi:hypothetical protein
MRKVFDGIDEEFAAWTAAQRSVASLDRVGSGAETIAHLREHGRITFVFCAFEGLPRIVRLYGRGEAIEPGDPGWDGLAAQLPSYPSVRSIVRAELTPIADSCGYGVPLYRYEGDRSQLGEWTERKGPEGLCAYQLERNRESLDSLPALRAKTLGG